MADCRLSGAKRGRETEVNGTAAKKAKPAESDDSDDDDE
jgi:hypothetical protein